MLHATPSLTVLHEQGEPLGLRLLRKVTLFGHDVSEHMQGTSDETLSGLLIQRVQGVSQMSGVMLQALTSLVDNKNRTKVSGG